MKNFFNNRKVPFGILDYLSSTTCTANKIIQQGLKKEYLTFRASKSYGTRNTLWS